MKILSIIILSATMTIGSHMGLANEEFNAVAVDGPGIFSGDKGEFSLFKSKDKEKQKATKQTEEKSVSYSSLKANNLGNLDSYTEFELFKEWKLAKSSNNDLYKEFTEWLNFLKFKASKNK